MSTFFRIAMTTITILLWTGFVIFISFMALNVVRF